MVHPYDPSSRKVDTSLHFLLNDHAKFYIHKVLDKGYVISVWDYTGNVEIKDGFYKKLPLRSMDNFYKMSPKDTGYYRMSKSQVGLKIDTPKLPISPFAKYDQLAYVDSWGTICNFSSR